MMDQFNSDDTGRPNCQGRRSRDENPVEILLVEDNPGDVRLIEEGFSATESDTTVTSVSDGETALDLLTEKCRDDSTALPDLAIVDLNLPGKTGIELLEAIRADSRLRRLPVVVLTSSADSDDIARCYDAEANAFVSKPIDPDEFIALVQAVDRFWVERVQLPPIEA